MRITLRVEHQRAGDLDELLLAARERSGPIAAALPDQREALGELLGAAAHEPLVAHDVAADQDVVPDGHQREQAALLRYVHDSEREHLARRVTRSPTCRRSRWFRAGSARGR